MGIASEILAQGFIAITVMVGVLGANIIWGVLLQPWFDKKQYIVYTVDMSLQKPGESTDAFMLRIREENLGRYEVVKG